MAADIRFYLDENVQVAIAEQMERRGVRVYTVRGLELRGDSDINHLKRATEMGCVLCTYDDDYLKLAASGIEHAGIIYGRQAKHTIGDWIRGLELICKVYTAEDMKNHVEYL